MRASACGGRDGCNGMRIASGGRDFVLGFTPFAAGGGWRIAEGAVSPGVAFGDLVGSLLCIVFEEKP